MTYFAEVKAGDRVWDFRYGWGTVTRVDYGLSYPIIVDFDNGESDSFLFNGAPDKHSKQTLFWDEIKFEPPERPKIRLKKEECFIDIAYNKIHCDRDLRVFDNFNHSLTRNDKKVAEKALKQIRRFTRLLALRDQECFSSRGYEFVEGGKNWTIKKDSSVKKNSGQWITSVTDCYFPDRVYFATEEDAQRVCDILNSSRFDLEEE